MMTSLHDRLIGGGGGGVVDGKNQEGKTRADYWWQNMSAITGAALTFAFVLTFHHWTEGNSEFILLMIQKCTIRGFHLSMDCKITRQCPHLIAAQLTVACLRLLGQPTHKVLRP